MATYSHSVYLQQATLKKEGRYKGILDGFDGPKTRAAFKSSLNARFKSHPGSVRFVTADGYPPRPAPAAAWKTKVFGRPGVKGGRGVPQAKLIPPFPMYYFGKRIRTIGCHQLIEAPLYNALSELLQLKGLAWIKGHRLDQYAGCYNPRNSRGGTSKSDHSWAIAIDLDAEHNGNHTPWKAGNQGNPGWATMPTEAVKVFRKHGFQVGFKNSGGTRRDMMHISYVNRT
tara:strand:- start:12414 stop:13097 length:684 start_codon:yes stop_codon:yes gene_type:complete